MTETTGSLIDRMLIIRDEKSALSKTITKLTEEFGALEQHVLKRLKDDDSIQTKSKTATATISELVRPNISDWEKFEEWIYDNQALYMLGKRPAAAAYREMIQRGDSVPGLEPYTETSISLRRHS